MTARTTNVSANPVAATLDRGRTARAIGNTDAATSVQPSTWCRNAERMKSHAFCSCTRNATPEPRNAAAMARLHALECSFPRTRASSTAPANIISSAQAPCASMWIVELAQNALPGHTRPRGGNARPGQGCARQARRVQTSEPTNPSACRHSPCKSTPVANSQWTCSAGGCTGLTHVLEQPGDDREVEEEPHGDHE